MLYYKLITKSNLKSSASFTYLGKSDKLRLEYPIIFFNLGFIF